MKVLLLGGGGNIGFWIEKTFLDDGYAVISYRRGISDRKRESHLRNIKFEVRYFDVNSPDAFKKIVIPSDVDIIIDCVCFNEKHASIRAEMLRNFSGIYMLVSSVAVYERHNGMNLISTKTKTENLSWQYAIRKRLTENYLIKNLKRSRVIVLRAGHTYDTVLPVPFGPTNWTIPRMILDGSPLLTHSSGESSWPLLYAADFSKRVSHIVHNLEYFKDFVNIVSNKPTSWEKISLTLFEALGVTPKINYLSPLELERLNPYWSDSVKYHKKFNERYVGPDQDIFSSISETDIDLISGLKRSIGFYLENGNMQSVNQDDIEKLNILLIQSREIPLLRLTNTLN